MFNICLRKHVWKMGSSETFCLKWDDFLLNTTSSFRDLRMEQEFADVTLSLGGNKTVEAHKVVLSSGSQFFKTLQHKTNTLIH